MELQDLLTLLAIFVALFGREFIDYLKKPKLVPHFDVTDVSYFHEIIFPLFVHGDVEHFSKGMN